jgi:glycosyltransferase involved in cell wall biosynthesis
VTKRKVLQLTIGLNHTVQQFDLFEEVARGFENSDYEFIFGVLTGKPDLDVIERLPCETVFFEFDKKQIAGLFPKAVPALYRYIDSNDIDTVITHRYKPSYMMAIMAPFLKKCRRVVSVFHGLKEFDRRSRQLMGRCFYTEKWRIVGVSQAVVDDLSSKGLPKQRLVLIRNAIDSKALIEQQYSKSDSREKLELPKDALMIGTLGRTKHVKGHDLLLEGFAPLCANNKKLHLVIMGGGELEGSLNELSKSLGIVGNVTITGSLPNAYRYLKALDIFIMPSRSEGLPIAMLEAMSTGLPIIGSNVGGIPEALGDAGVVIEAGSANAVTQALEALVNASDDERDQIVRALKVRIKEDFSIESYHKAFRELVAE